MNDKELQQEILALENDVKQLEATINAIKQRIVNLKDIAWDRQSKKESSQMFNVLQERKESTEIKSNVGNIKVDKDFMEKEIRKHLDNPNLRGMVNTQELLSFPKVAKNVKAEFIEGTKNYTWKIKANDESLLVYGSREYISKDNQKTNRLLTAHSKTEENERMAEVDRRGHPYHSIFNDFNFRKSANERIVPQNKDENQAKQEQIKALKEKVKESSKNLKGTPKDKDIEL